MTSRTRLPRIGLPFLPLLVASCLQYGSGDIELDAPKVEVKVQLDKETYHIGDAIVATVDVTNLGGTMAVLPVPGRGICQFFAKLDEAPADAIEEVEFLVSPDDQTSFADVEAGDSTSRRLLLYRFARTPGKYVLFARYRTDEVAISEAGEDSSEVVTFTIDGERSFDRDREGRLTDVEAIRVAREHFKAAADAPADTLLAKDESRLNVWLVTLTMPAGEQKTEPKSVLISPYTGKVMRESNTTVAAARAKPR